MRMKHLLLAGIAAVATVGCTDPAGNDAGLDARSRSTGEANERLGNDPAQQNTGRGSTPETEPSPQSQPQQ